MVAEIVNSEAAPKESKSWCVEWFGSQGDFISRKVTEPISLERFAGLKSLYAVGPLEFARGEVSIFDSVPLIAEVQNGSTSVSVDFCRRTGFLVYAIVENWRRATIPVAIEDERHFEEHLLPFAVESGIDVDQPFHSWPNAMSRWPRFTSCAIRARENTTRSCTKRPKPIFTRGGVYRDHWFLFAPTPRRFYSTRFQLPHAPEDIG